MTSLAPRSSMARVSSLHQATHCTFPSFSLPYCIHLVQFSAIDKRPQFLVAHPHLSKEYT